MVSQADIYEVLSSNPGKWFTTKSLCKLLNENRNRIAAKLSKLKYIDDVELKIYSKNDDLTPGERDSIKDQKMGYLVRINKNACRGVRLVRRIN